MSEVVYVKGFQNIDSLFIGLFFVYSSIERAKEHIIKQGRAKELVIGSLKKKTYGLT